MSLDDTNDRIIAKHGKAGLRGGIVLGIFGIVFNLILYFAGLLTEQWASWISLPIVLAILYFIQKNFRDKEQNGFITFGKAWKLGFLASVISTVFNAIFVFILYSADSSLQDAALEKAYSDMMDQGMTTSQIDQAMPMVESMTGPTAMIFWALIIGVIFGLLFPLITSAIVQRKHPLD
ncbi:MAG: DUF4199 domain-containing protein [Flavobacteriales bacterium]|nr:DUF4199 domain-containing protein [Flavobacteriales bacterium]NNK80822.1 DUF4199 domain-containing protein [Flavobacteriales bacterium]